MQPFRLHHGLVAPLVRRDIDTDQIIPKEYLKRLEKTGYGQFLFNDWRTAPDGARNPEFVLNQPRYEGASILLAGPNFGCGSSREHAAWALQDFGFAAVIAPSFADIFRANAVANGLLPLVLPDDIVAVMDERARTIDGYSVEIDLEGCTVTDDQGLELAFTVEKGARQRLLEGLDDIGLILKHEAEITQYESRNAGSL
jgi:3-isopropylmalate/(R)-2-methylmalate dehydratase small subunit